jgi:hypothetical protein
MRDPEAYLRWCVPNDEFRGYRQDCLESFLWRAQRLDLRAIARAVKRARQARDGHERGEATTSRHAMDAERETAIAKGLEGLRMLDAWYAKHVPEEPSAFRQSVQTLLRELEDGSKAPRSELPGVLGADPLFHAATPDDSPRRGPGARVSSRPPPSGTSIEDVQRELQRLGIGRDFRAHLLHAVGLTDPRPKK